MPSKNTRRKRSKIRQKKEVKDWQSEEETKEQQQNQLTFVVKKTEIEDNLFLIQDYVKQAQIRALLEVALLCLLHESGLDMSTWKLSDIGKSLFTFVMGGSASRQQAGQPSADASADPPSASAQPGARAMTSAKNSYSSEKVLLFVFLMFLILPKNGGIFLSKKLANAL